MLAWAPSVDCSRSCHARSTIRRIAYEGNFWPVERDLQDVCRQPCSNSTAYSEVSIRAGNLPQPELPLPDSNGGKSESQVDDQEGDEERFQGRTGVENRVRNYVHDFSRKLEAPQTAVPRDLWSSGRTLGPTKGELTGAVNRNQLHPNSPDSFELERCSSLRSSPPTTSHQKVLSQAATEGGVEGAAARRLRIGEEASDRISQAPLLTKILQLAERATSPHNLVAEGLDGSESLRSSRGGPLKERSNPWSENVELVRSSDFFFHENIVECSTDIGASERDDVGFHNVIIAQASHGKAAEPTAVGESGTPRSQRGHHSNVHSQGRQERPKTVNAVSGSLKPQPLTDLASRGALCDALDIDSIPHSSGGDQPQQGSTSARIERGPEFSRITSDSERDLEEIATTKGRRYTERVGNVGVSTEPTAGRQINPDRTGDTSTGWKSQDPAGGTAGVLTVIPERIGRTSDSLTVRELAGVSESHSAGERVGGAESYSAQEGTGGSTESRLTIRERTGGSPSEGNKIPERIGAGSERDSAEKVLEKGKEEKLHPREEGHQRQSESSEDRRLRARLDGASGGASGGGDDTEEPKIVRPARPSGGKDRHSKVNTAKGPRDRRVRLSVPTAVQFYDVQDRLGFDQPSKAVEWLIQKAKDAIDRIPVDGKDPRVPGACGSDISHHVPDPSSYDVAVSGLVSGSLSCTPTGSFQGPSSNPYGDQLSFLMDPSAAQGMFAPLQATQGNFSGPTFGLGRIDLTRGNSGSISTDGGRTNESTGSPLARVESRTKARERARERTKKGPGRDGSQGNVTSGGSPSSSQSPPFNHNPTFSSFNASNSMQGSVHSLSLQSQHQTPLLSGIYEGNPFSRILQGSHQAGSLQNLILHNPPLDSTQFSDQIQSPLQNAFLAQAQATLQSPSHTMNPLQQSQLQTMQVNAQGALHLGPTFNPGPSSSCLSEASMSSPHYPSVSALPSSQSPPVPQLSVLGISPVSSLGSHYPTSSPTPIPPGFSPGPTASAFRAHSLSISQCSNQSQQQQLQGVSRVQRPVPTFSAAPSISIPTSQAGSSSSRASAHTFYLGTSSNTFMGCLQPIQSERLNSPSFSPRSNVSYEHGQRPRPIVSSPRLTPYQVSNSQIPARIQGLDDMEELEEELNPATPSSPHP